MNKNIYFGLILFTIVGFATKMQTLSPIFINEEDQEIQDSIYNFEVATIDGTSKSIADYKGKVFLIVNTASQCGYASQFEGLQKLQEQYSDKGFTVLAFPCNQFENQEPLMDKEIETFYKTQYHITFPIFDKIEVNGSSTSPLFEYLKRNAKNKNETTHVEWNFTKFLVNQNGVVLRRYAPKVLPKAISQDIAKLLN